MQGEKCSTRAVLWPHGLSMAIEGGPASPTRRGASGCVGQIDPSRAVNRKSFPPVFSGSQITATYERVLQTHRILVPLKPAWFLTSTPRLCCAFFRPDRLRIRRY